MSQVGSNGLSNELGIDGALSRVSDLSTYWKYSSLHYYRLTDKGTFGGRVNIANRFGTTALQYQAEAYPVLSNGAYAALSLAYANTTQTLFASYQYRVEGYFPLPRNFEFSLGQGGQLFPRFENDKIFLFTGSVGKYINNYFVWFRPIYYTPVKDLLYEIGVRRTFDDPNMYVAVKALAGHLPDIGDLPPLSSVITLSEKALEITGQFPLTNNYFLQADVSYQHQVYPAGLIRNIATGFLGVFVRFN
jgi:YaiO family outer membrane protein